MDVWRTAFYLKRKSKDQSWLSEVSFDIHAATKKKIHSLVLSLISHVFICVSEAEADSGGSTVHYVIGAILYRTLGLILPAPK